jgi:hypothetical protein
MPVAAPQIQFSFSTKELDRTLDALLEGGAVVSNIYNDAKSEDGTYYWTIVNNGRGPVRPVNAKVLHWIDPETGKDVFAMYSRGVPPVHMRENAILVVGQAIIPGEYVGLDRATVQRFVNAVASEAVKEMQARTPVRTGQLRDKYRIGEE